MEPSQQSTSPRKRFNSPGLSMNKIKHTDSMDGHHFDLISPTIPMNFFNKLNFDKLTPKIPQESPSQIPLSEVNDIQDLSQKLNSSERKMVSALVKTFISEQQEKPEKIFVKINGIAVNSIQRNKIDQCRIDKIQICRYDPELQENNSEETERDESVFSFADIPSVSKIILSQTSQINTSKKISDKKTSVRKNLKVSSNLMKICKTLSISYLPYSKSSIYKKQAQSPSRQSFVAKKQSCFSDHSEERTKIDHLQAIAFTKLVTLDLILKRKELQETNAQNKEYIQSITLKKFKQMKEQNSKAMKKSQQQIEELKKALEQKANQLEQALKTNRTLEKVNEKLKDKNHKLQADYEKLIKEKKDLEEQIKTQKEILKRLKMEESAKSVTELKTTRPINNYERKEELFQSYCIPTIPFKDKPFSIKILPSQQLINTRGLTATEIQTPVLLRSKYQPVEAGNYFNTPKIAVSQITQNKVYSKISNPKVAEQLLNYKRNELSKKSSNIGAIRRQQNVTPSSSSESSKILQTYRSFDNLKMGPRGDDNQSKLEKNSNFSGRSSKSPHKLVGYKKQFTARQGMLLDYMLSDIEPPGEEEEQKVKTRQSKFLNKDETSSHGSNRSDKKRFKIKY